jgi:hypothetical protein
MDKRIEVRCTDEQLARWREAAGEASLSAWVRYCCDSRVDAQFSELLRRTEPWEPNVVLPSYAVPVPRPSADRSSFKPDFGSRLKEK